MGGVAVTESITENCQNILFTGSHILYSCILMIIFIGSLYNITDCLSCVHVHVAFHSVSQ